MPRKDSCWIEKSGLYGTWTFTTQTMTDVGYYKGIAYVVMHLMPDPMQVKSCIIKGNEKTKGCIEANNRACSHVGALDNEKEACINTETTQLEWSDVTAFFQFGFQLRTGIVRKTYHDVHTSDWVGPYNIIMAPIEKHHHQDEKSGNESGDPTKFHDKNDLFVSRYVTTPWTESQLQRPFASSAIFNFDSNILEDVVGTTAINETIHVQKEWRGTTPKSRSLYGVSVDVDVDVDVDDGGVVSDSDSDPYAKYSRTCAHGDLQPILPKLEIHRITRTSSTDPDNQHPNITYSMKLDYPVLSLPDPATDGLYKLWPAMKKHLGGQFPLQGPYCYGNDPNRAYAINLSYDSAANADAAVWKAVKGCVAPWPCWKDDPKPPVLPPSSLLPDENGSTGSYIIDPKGLEFMIVYAFGFLLFVSLVFNCQLANKLKQLQQSHGNGNRRQMLSQHQQQQHLPFPPSSAFGTSSRSRGSATTAHITTNTVPASSNDYLQEAGGLRSNSLEEPLLTASSDEMDHGTQEPSGVEESKEEAE